MKILFAVLASAAFLALAGFEVYHDLVRGEPWPGYAAAGNAVVFVLAPLWLLGAVSVWIPKDLAWLGIFPGILASLMHGLGTTIGQSRIGPVFLAAAPLLLVLCWRARRPDPIDALAGDGLDQDRAARLRRREPARSGR